MPKRNANKDLSIEFTLGDIKNIAACLQKLKEIYKLSPETAVSVDSILNKITIFINSID